MHPPVTQRHRHRTGATIAIILAGWLTLAGAYMLVLPLFGVVSPITWTLTWISWLWVIAVPALMAIRRGPRTAWPLPVLLTLLSLLAGALLWLVKPPALTVEGYYRLHRDQLAALADDYRAGPTTAPVELSLRSRPLSIDGRAYHRCGLTDPDTGDQPCALYLPLWQNWRAEQAAGIAYYPTPPGPDASLATASGDIGGPIRHLGDGWWLVD